MSILDRRHGKVVWVGSGPVQVSTLTPAEKIRLTIEARCAAADVAARVLAASPGWSTSSDVRGFAAPIEAWILRDGDDEPDEPTTDDG